MGASELEEARTLLDSADRGKKQADLELGDARAAVNDMTTINSKANSDKRRMEAAARLADELRSEQDHAASQEKAKRALDAQISELHQRLEEANDMAAKGSKNAIARMEARIRELEAELGTAQSRTSETYKAYQKCERRLKELQFQQDEEKKNQSRMSDLATKLQQKIKTYKKQIEEAEEIAALNLAKYRKAQQELEEA